ncbi:MAG TPA: iron-containing redox enzyme family protein [Actinomycetota bacterium]|nr:iron-containing redox enzyme family protein [Actinomycetota bacterium]
MHDLDKLVLRLDNATADRRLLDHSFYKAWAAGDLTLEDLAHYSTQYWRQVEAFPGYLRTIADRVETPEARDILIANLKDEVGQDHPGLWLDFASSVGVKRDDVTEASVEPETTECVSEFGEVAREAPLPYALGMLYGYESQTPAVAETKVAGLREHYEIDGPGVEYFRLHGVLDVEHSREMATAISLVSRDDVAEAEAGAARGAGAIWTLLNGVERVRQAT